MIRIAISEAAFDAIAKTLTLGSVGYENAVTERRERYVWLPPNVVDRLRAQRRSGESYSDVILGIRRRNAFSGRCFLAPRTDEVGQYQI